MRRFAGILGVVIASAIPVPLVAADMYDNWLDLWTRCRIAVETVQEVDIEDLSEIEITEEISEELRNRPGFSYRIWGRDGDDFVILEGEWRASEGTVRRGCDIRRLPGAPALSEIEEAMLIRTFLIARYALIANRTHEVRDPDYVFSIPLGVGPIDENANGCRVISSLMIHTPSGHFFSGTGEQARSGCAGSSFLYPEEEAGR